MDSTIRRSKKPFPGSGRGSMLCQREPNSVFFLDPLEPDQTNDPMVCFSHRNLARIVSIATATGARFGKEHSLLDPVEWMYLPQRVFSDQPAITACLKQENYQRGMIVHGLALSGLTLPSQIDMLLQHQDTIEARDAYLSPSPPRPGRRQMDGPALFTASISDTSNSGRYLIFIAVVAKDEEEVWMHLLDRFGERTATLASIRRGFDPSEPIAIALVSEPLADTLRLVAAAPTSRLADGLDVQLESRFLS